MKNVFLLLVLLICILAYVRAEQSETWNSWMVALGANGAATSAAPAVSDATGAQPVPVRVPLVGGVIQNGDFVSGNGGYWEGDGTADPSGKGLVIKLDPSSWTRVYQSFRGDQSTRYSIEVTYRLSPGLILSQNPADYTNISERLQISGFERFPSLGMTPGHFYGTVGDPSSTSIALEVYSPQIGSTGVQDYQHDYSTIPAGGNKIFALAFPPGTGTVTLLTAYVINR